MMIHSAARLIEGRGKDLPDWYLVFPEGENELEGGPRYLVDRKAWTQVEARLIRRGIEVVVDYEHQTLSGGKAPAAGWAREWRYRDGVGIEARIDWTEEAAAYLASGEYRYYSPVFAVREADRRLVAIQSLALTNTPRTNNLKPLLAKLGAEMNREQEDDMNLREQLIAKLGLAGDASEEDIVAAVAAAGARREGAVVPAEVRAALGVESDDVSTVVASIHALKQETRTMVSREDFEALKAQIARRDAEDAVAAALAEGKITPDQRDWAAKYAQADPEGFATFVAKAPVVVPVDGLPGGGAGDGDDMDQVTLEVAKMMDITEEDIKKYGGVQ